MSKTTHTPGPWHATRAREDGSRDIGAANGANVAVVLLDGGPAETRANALLIAAAPDLLAALKAALAALDADPLTAPMDPITARLAQTWMRAKFDERARAAIAKAEAA